MTNMRLDRNFRNLLAAALGDYLRRDGTLPMTGNLDLDGNSLILDADGDTKLYAAADDDIRLYVGGSDKWRITANFLGDQLTGGAAFQNVTATTTVPTVNPRRGDDDTGLGWAAADQLSLITGGNETMRLLSSVDTDSDLNDILLTAVSGFHGIALVTSLTDNVSAMYHIDNVTITGVISANALFSNTPGNAGTYNFYYNVDQFKLENKVGNDKSVKVVFWVVPT